MIERFGDKFRIRLDPQRDPYIKTSTGATGELNFVYDHGPASFGLWVTTKKPRQTYNAIAAKFPAAKTERRTKSASD